jgi:ArsR family transcriptional regulator
VILPDLALAVTLDQGDELGGGHWRVSWHPCGSAAVLILDDIDVCQYHFGMRRLVDPDALLLQGAADPTRLAILRQLAGGDGVCACDFTACCDVAQPTVSHHLKVLRESGWVRSERRASYVVYWLRPEAVDRFRSIAGELAPAIGGPAPRALPVLQPGA